MSDMLAKAADAFVGLGRLAEQRDNARNEAEALRAEVARLREALEDIVTTLAVGEDWCGFCGTLSHHPHIRDCPYPIARRALGDE